MSASDSYDGLACCRRCSKSNDVSLDDDNLPTDPEALRALLIAERAQHAAEMAQVGSERDRLRAIIVALQRHRFGRRSERLDPDQLALALEDLQQSLAAAEAQEERTAAQEQNRPVRRRKINRGALPAHLPRFEVVVDVADRTCPCCAGELHRIGEDVAERLDVIPLQFRVLMIRRPKYACRTCPRHRGAGAGSAATDRRWPADRGVGRACHRRQVCRSLSALPPSPDLRPPGDRSRPLHPGGLDRSRRLVVAPVARQASRRVARFAQAVCRRDDGARARPRPGAHQDRSALGLRS